MSNKTSAEPGANIAANDLVPGRLGELWRFLSAVIGYLRLMQVNWAAATTDDGHD
jgi:hypothetical protein